MERRVGLPKVMWYRTIFREHGFGRCEKRGLFSQRGSGGVRRMSNIEIWNRWFLQIRLEIG